MRIIFRRPTHDVFRTLQGDGWMNFVDTLSARGHVQSNRDKKG